MVKQVESNQLVVEFDDGIFSMTETVLSSRCKHIGDQPDESSLQSIVNESVIETQCPDSQSIMVIFKLCFVVTL